MFFDFVLACFFQMCGHLTIQGPPQINASSQPCRCSSFVAVHLQHPYLKHDTFGCVVLILLTFNLLGRAGKFLVFGAGLGGQRGGDYSGEERGCNSTRYLGIGRYQEGFYQLREVFEVLGELLS